MIAQIIGFTRHLLKEWNNRVYFRLRKMSCKFKDQVRARQSGEKWGLEFSNVKRSVRVQCGCLFISSFSVEICLTGFSIQCVGSIMAGPFPLQIRAHEKWRLGHTD